MTNLGLIGYNKRFFTQLWVHLEVLMVLDYWKGHLYILILLMEMWFRIVSYSWVILVKYL